MPLVSVILPAYRAEDYLASALDDLLRQSHDDLEIVVVDDGSDDGTAAIAARYASQYDKVVFVPLAENGGVARARQAAVIASRGKYLWFVDVDDARSPLAVELLVNAARQSDADVVVCGAEYRYDDGTTRAIRTPRLPEPIAGRAAFRLLLTGGITGHLWNKLFDRKLAESIEFTPARVHSDLAMVAQMLASARRVTSIDDTLYSYLLRSGSIIRSGTRRGDSLTLVGEAVLRTASSLDARIPTSPEFRYFELRYLLLSRMKDAMLGSYERAERSSSIRAIRRSITWRSIAVVVGRRDLKRLLLSVTAKISPRLHRRVLYLAAEGSVVASSME